MNNQWIRCSERLPDLTDNRHRDILIYDANMHMSITWASAMESMYNRAKVTHWMELPDKPEMEE